MELPQAIEAPELDDLISALKSGDFVAPSPSRLSDGGQVVSDTGLRCKYFNIL